MKKKILKVLEVIILEVLVIIIAAGICIAAKSVIGFDNTIILLAVIGLNKLGANNYE